MTSPHEDASADDKSTPREEVTLDLNFVPEWARKPAGENPYANADYREERPRRRDRGGSRRGAPGGRGGPRRQDRRRPRPPGDDRGHGHGDQGHERRGGHEDFRGERGPHRGPPPRPRLPLDVSFLPDRDKLGVLVRELHKRPRAYPLVDLAALMMQKPEQYLVKLQGQSGSGGDGPLSLYQCKRCREVFQDRDEAIQHAAGRHLDEVFDVAEVDLEPPSGNFVCVCRCRRTGILLGPPNYHGYQEKVQQVMADHFPGWSADRYRDQIETVHDEEVVEKWRNGKRTRREYRPRGQTDAEPLSMEAARAYFMEHHAGRLIHKSNRVILPATVARELENETIKNVIRDAWQRESRFPFTMSMALRPAFKHMRLFTFKIDERRTFVTSVHPSPVDPAHAVDSVREILGHLEDHPGCKRKDLVEGLRPGAAADSPQVAELIRQCKWLIDKGHVIEFFDGTLSLPALRKGRR
jgi:hypothetical protein